MHTYACSSSIPDKIQTFASCNWFLNLFLKTPIKELNDMTDNRDQNLDKSNKSAHSEPLRLSALWNNTLRNHQMANSLPELPNWWECLEKREQWIQCSLLDGCEDFRDSSHGDLCTGGIIFLGGEEEGQVSHKLEFVDNNVHISLHGRGWNQAKSQPWWQGMNSCAQSNNCSCPLFQPPRRPMRKCNFLTLFFALPWTFLYYNCFSSSSSSSFSPTSSCFGIERGKTVTKRKAFLLSCLNTGFWITLRAFDQKHNQIFMQWVIHLLRWIPSGVAPFLSYYSFHFPH